MSSSSVGNQDHSANVDSSSNETQLSEQALMQDPTYAPYAAYFKKFDSDGSNSIDQKELLPLLHEVGYNFSASLVSAILQQYFPGISTLKFSDFLRLMQFSLSEINAMFRAHLTPSVEAMHFQTLGNEQVVHDLMGHIEYDAATGQYDFKMAETRLAQLQQYDNEQIAVVLQQKLVQAEQVQKQEQEKSSSSTDITNPLASPSANSSATAASSKASESAVAADPRAPSIDIPSMPPTPSVSRPGTASSSSATASSAKTPQSRVDLFAMNDDDEAFCRDCFDLFLLEFDSDGDGAIGRAALGHSLRAMGVEPSEKELAAMFAAIDTDGSGLVDYMEFKKFYAAFWRDRVRRGGLDSVRIEALLRRFDSEGAGEIPTPDFRFALKSVCSRLTDADIDTMCTQADTDGDGKIDYVEFIAFLEKNQPLNVSLRKKLIRASSSRESPAEYLAAIRRMPSTYRRPTLGDYATHPSNLLSSRLAPRLDPDGLGFFDLAVGLGPDGAQPIIESPDIVFTSPHPHDSPSSSSAHSLMGLVLSPSSAAVSSSSSSSSGAHKLARTPTSTRNLRSTKNGPTSPLNRVTSFQPYQQSRQQQPPAPLCLSLELQRATGVPIPADDTARAAIKSRFVRVCLFEGNTPISNELSLDAQWNAAEEDVWKFEIPELQWNHVAFKTKRKQTMLLVELNILVEPEIRLTNSQVLADRTTCRPRVELCCAFGTLDLIRDEWLKPGNGGGGKTMEMKVPLHGGSLLNQMPIRAEEVLARRTGFMSLFSSSAPASEIVINIHPLPSLGDRDRLFVSQLPLDIIVPLKAARVLRLYRELLCDVVLRSPNLPLAFPLAQHQHAFSSPLALFLQVVDQPELLLCLCWYWEEVRHQLRDRDRRDESSGRACALVKQRFAQALMEMMPVLQSAASMAALGNSILEAVPSSTSDEIASSSSSSISATSTATTPAKRTNSKTPSVPTSNRKTNKSNSSSAAAAPAVSTSSSPSSLSSTDTFAARVARAKSILRFGHPLLALNSDALAVSATGPRSVLESLGANFTAALDASSSRGIFSVMFSVGSSQQQHPALNPSLGGAAVPLALNSLYAPFSAHDTLMFDPIHDQMLHGDV